MTGGFVMKGVCFSVFLVYHGRTGYLNRGSIHGAGSGYSSFSSFFSSFLSLLVGGEVWKTPIPFIIPKGRKGYISAIGRFYFSGNTGV